MSNSSKPKLNILIAYPYFSKSVEAELKNLDRSDYRLIVDSGAFTAWNSGKEIKLDEYCSFLKTIEYLKPDLIVQLDVFGDPEQSWKNFLEMQKRGFHNVCPVFTRGDTLEMLEEMYTYTDYIFFGGIVVGGKNHEYVQWFLSKNKGRKCHWLGFVKSDFMKKYKPESVDSSSWNTPSRYGNLALYDGFGNLKSMKREDFKKPPTAKTRKLLHTTGIPMSMAKQLQNDEAWRIKTKEGWWQQGTETSYLISTIAHIKRAMAAERMLGTKIYLAACQEIQLRMLIRAYKIITEGK